MFMSGCFEKISTTTQSLELLSRCVCSCLDYQRTVFCTLLFPAKEERARSDLVRRPRSTKELCTEKRRIQRCPCVPERIGIWRCWVLWREKNPWSKDENQQQTQPSYDVNAGNRTRATLVGGECSHHCAIPV